jgi:hypothetical protein
MSLSTLRATFQRWLFRVSGPEPAPIHLGQRRIFVLPTRFGVALGATLFVMLLASINYALSLGFALTFLIGGVAWVSIHHDVAAHAQLRTRRTDDDHVLDHHRRLRQRGADLRVGVLHLPQFLAGLGVQRDDVAVELGLEDLAVTVGQTAVHDVAAGDRADRRVLLGLVFPQDLVRVVQVDGVGDVGEGRVDVHDAVHHQRTAFVAVQHAGREGPRGLQVLHVAAVDLLQTAVVAVVVVLALHDPLAIVLRQLDQLGVGERGTRCGRQRETGDRGGDGAAQTFLVQTGPAGCSSFQ